MITSTSRKPQQKLTPSLLSGNKSRQQQQHRYVSSSSRLLCWRSLAGICIFLLCIYPFYVDDGVDYGDDAVEGQHLNTSPNHKYKEVFLRGLLSNTATADDNEKQRHPIPEASMTVPMHYESGSHHIYIYVGSPIPQRQTLILDTGSRYMAFPCEPCKDCGQHASPKYWNDTQSTTHRDNLHPNCVFAKKKRADAVDDSCTFDQTYLEGSSWKAKEVEDMIFLGTGDQEESVEDYMPHLSIPFVFGCQTAVTGYFTHQYSDGILGMGKQTDKNSLLQTMVQAGAIDRAAFAMCLSQTGGTLSLGGSGLARPDSKAFEHPEQYHIGDMHYSKLTAEHGLYALEVYNVYIDDYCMTCDNTPDRTINDAHARIMSAFEAGKGAILDSGTTDTYFPRAAEHIFATVWEEKLGSPLRASRGYSYAEFLAMPIISVVFAPNATLHAHPSSYMEGVLMDITATTPDVVVPWEGNRTLTMRLYMEEPEGAVLGANFMYNYDVLYDLQQSRVGFARANCGFDREAQDRMNKERTKADKEEAEKEKAKIAARAKAAESKKKR